MVRQHLLDRHRGLFASVTGLLLALEPHHFLPDGEIRVKCRGTIAAEFWEDDVENVFGKEANGGSGTSGGSVVGGREGFYGGGANKDKLVKVLEVQESHWPGTEYNRNIGLCIFDHYPYARPKYVWCKLNEQCLRTSRANITFAEFLLYAVLKQSKLLEHVQTYILRAL